MKTIKGQHFFWRSLPVITRRQQPKRHRALGGDLGYEGVQIPSWDARLFDLNTPPKAKTIATPSGCPLPTRLVATELSTHCRDSSSPSIPRTTAAFDGFARPSVRGNSTARQAWAVEQLLFAAKASANLGRRRTSRFRRARLAVFVSVAATPRWIGSKPLSTNSRALESNSRRVRQSRVSTSASRFIPAKDCTTALLSKCFCSACKIIPAATSSSIQAISSCTARLSRIHRSLSRTA